MKTLIHELKQLIIETLSLEDMSPGDIDKDEPLFDDGLGLDSIDALELGVAIKNKYNVSVKDEREEDVHKYFYSVQNLADFIHQRRSD